MNIKTIQINIPNNIGPNDCDFSMILAAKLSIGQAAEMAGIGKSYISRIENRLIQPTFCYIYQNY